MAAVRMRAIQALALCLVLVGSATAAAPSEALRVRLVVVESCRDAATGAADPSLCAAPHQRADAARLPEQLRALAPAPDAMDGNDALLMVF